MDDEERIREEAYKLWVADGCPDGLADKHWTEAKEIIAARDSYKSTLQSVEDTVDEPVEPAIAFENQGDIPGLSDIGEGQAGPTWEAARETSQIRSMSVEDDATSKRTKKSAQRDDAKQQVGTGASPQRD